MLVLPCFVHCFCIFLLLGDRQDSSFSIGNLNLLLTWYQPNPKMPPQTLAAAGHGSDIVVGARSSTTCDDRRRPPAPRCVIIRCEPPPIPSRRLHLVLIRCQPVDPCPPRIDLPSARVNSPLTHRSDLIYHRHHLCLFTRRDSLCFGPRSSMRHRFTPGGLLRRPTCYSVSSSTTTPSRLLQCRPIYYRTGLSCSRCQPICAGPSNPGTDPNSGLDLTSATATPLPTDPDTIAVSSTASGVVPSDLAVAIATIQAEAVAFCERAAGIEAASQQEQAAMAAMSATTSGAATALADRAATLTAL
jgi:hypothetical protein